MVQNSGRHSEDCLELLMVQMWELMRESLLG